jgi:hypothetical protein
MKPLLTDGAFTDCGKTLMAGTKRQGTTLVVPQMAEK